MSALWSIWYLPTRGTDGWYTERRVLWLGVVKA